MLGKEKGSFSFEADVNKPMIEQQVNSLEVADDEGLIVSAHEDNSIKFFDANSGKCIQTIVGHTDSVSCLSYVAANKTVLSGGHDGAVRAWDLRSFSCVFDMPAHRRKYDEGVNTIAYNELFKLVATGKFFL